MKKKATVWVIMHYEILQVNPFTIVDSVQFHVASSRKKAEEHMRQSWVEPYSWWQVHPYVVDFEDCLHEGEEVYYYSHRGKPLRSAPCKQAIKAYERKRPWLERRRPKSISETQTQSSLVTSGNTNNPSLIVLRKKGYDLWLEHGENRFLWCARKDDQSFLAYSAPELLGLVTLWEHLGESWNQQRPRIYSELIKQMED